MTYAANKILPGRELVTVAELDLTSCSLTFGVLPCTASGAAGTECYNTRSTCQAIPSFTRTILTYRFSTPIDSLPTSEAMYPAISGKPTFSSAILDPGGKLGKRATVSIKIKDFPYHDRGIDKYVSTRPYTPEDQGTFFGKLLARNIHYIGRTLRVRTGYWTSPWNWANFQDRDYIIESIDGPDKNGFVSIKGKDILKLADNDRIQIPAPSLGTLTTDITSASTIATVYSGEGAAYAASGTVSIGSEDCLFTRSTDTFTLTRAQNGTKAEAHSKGDTVQECKVWTDTNVVDIIHEILKTYVGISETKLPYDAGLDIPTGINNEWDDEKSVWLSSYKLTRTISKPTGAKKLLEELSEQTQLTLRHDLVTNEIKLKANVPPLANATITSFNDNNSFSADSITVKDEQGKRLSQVWVYYGKIDNTGDEDAENYSSVVIYQDATREGADLYDSTRIKIIFANWLSLEGQALALSGRLIARYADSPKTITFIADVKDDVLTMGDLLDMNTHRVQDVDGSNISQRVQIVGESDPEPGHNKKYTGLTSAYTGTYGFIGPNSLNDRTAESSANKQAYAFVSLNTGLFANGDDAYKII